MTERFKDQRQNLTEGQLFIAMSNLPDKNMVGTFARRELYVGQEGPRQQLVDIITKSPTGTVAVVSEPLGAGKSALISMVRDDLIKGGYATFGECLRTNAIHLDKDTNFEEFYWSNVLSNEKPEDWQSIKPKVLFIEEFDTKSRFGHLQEEMRAAGQFLERDVPIIVLSGDYSLRNPELVKLINSPYEPINVGLDSLNPEVLKKALELRISYALDLKGQKIDMDALFEPEFLAHLIPATEPPVDNMRNTLVILQEMADELAYDTADQPARFSGFLYHSRWNSSESLRSRPKAWHFVSWLHTYIKDNHNSSAPMRPLTVSEFRNLYPLNDISEDDYQDIVKYLTSVGILESVGIPYFYDENEKFPEPYLPSQSTFLDAEFDPLPPKTPGEVEREREIAVKKAEFSRLNTLYQEKIIEESVFFQQRDKLLGIDTLLDSFVKGEIDKETFIARKQELLNTYQDINM